MGMAINMLKPRLNADGTITLFMDNESMSFTAKELDEQIESLGHARAQMSEQVPKEAPLIKSVVINPRYFIRIDNVTKASLLSLRHDGFGWLNFELPAQEVLNMQRMWNDIVSKLDLDSSDFYTETENPSTKPH
jgi:hypothetical protein